MSEVNASQKFGGAFRAMRLMCLDSGEEVVEAVGVRLEIDRPSETAVELYGDDVTELIVLTLYPLPDPLAQRGPDIAPIEPVTIMFERRVFDEAYDVAAEEYEQEAK